MKTLNYWGSCGLDLTSTLHLSAGDTLRSTECLLKIFTPKGVLFKELTIAIDAGKTISLEMENLIAEILPESGFRHSLINVSTDQECASTIRFKTMANTFFAGPMRVVSTFEPAFFPKNFSRSISSYLVLSNPTEESIESIVRVIAQNRAPEMNYILPPYSTRLVNLDTEFDEISELSRKQRLSSYIRVRCRVDNALTVGMFEQYFTDIGCNYVMVN